MNFRCVSKFLILFSNDNWVTNSGAATVINPEIKTSMIDNGDGTYSYSFTSIKSGKLTVLIYLDSSLNGVYAEFWNNINLSGNVDKTIRYPVINYYWYPLVTTTQCDLTSGRLTTYLTVPKNDTYTIYYKHDNGGRLYFQNVLEIINWIDSVTEESFTISLNTETKYKVVSEFYNVGGPAQSYLSWSYPGQAKEIIPSNYLTYKGLTSSSPLQVTVNPSWGNGVRSLNEQCDDGNTKNDDGWSSNCIVEEYWTCTGGSMTSLDIWSWSKPSSKANMKLYTYLFLGLIALGWLSNLLSSSLMQGWIQCIFNFINQVQLILLLPMLWSVMPEVVVDFISSLNICLLNFGIVFESQPEMNSFFSLNYNQTNSYLNSIKLKSGSALVNISGVIYTLLMFVILHFLLCFLIYGVKCNNRDIWFHKALNSIFKMLTFGLYIQQIINSLLVMLISSSSEFGRHDLSSK